MLALAHGLKGLLFWNYDSYESTGGVHVIGIVDENGNKSEIWHLIHNNFVPGLKGKLGDKLLGLDYTGNYINARYVYPSEKQFIIASVSTLRSDLTNICVNN